MADKIALGRYYPGNSFLHRLDPRTKFLAVIFWMIVVLIPRAWQPITVLVAFSALLVLMTRVPLKEIYRTIKPIMFMILLAFVINLFASDGKVIWSWWKISITDKGLLNAFLMSIRLLILVLDTSLLLTLTTTPMQLADGLESLLSPLKKVKFPVHEMAMIMSIALRFVPTLLEETDKIMKAQSSRGADYDTGGLIKKARGFVSILIPLFIGSFRRAEELATAMEARCYHGGEGRTKLNELHYTRLDIYFAVLIVSAGAAVLGLHYGLV